MTPKTALILRATGSQGRAAIFHLLKSGWAVHAFVSDPKDPRATALQSLGAKIFQGTLSDAPSIETAIAGCDALFLNQMPSFTNDSEVKDARAIIELASKSGVKHIVHSTTLALSNPNVRIELKENMVAPGVIGKADVEDLVKTSAINWTILRGGWFTTNITQPFASFLFPELAEGKFVSSYKPEWVLPLVDPNDIGAFIASAFNDPERFKGRVIPVVSEKMRVDDMIKEIEQVAERKIEVKYRSDIETREELEKGNMLVAINLVTETLGKWVDIEEVKTWGVPLTSFRTFLENNKENIMQSFDGTVKTRLNILK